LSCIYGHGLIAKSFKKSVKFNNAVIFASGVSNSQELNNNQFEKELLILNEALIQNPNKIFIYFSTISAYSKSLSPYIAHKLSIEKLISSTADRYLILRLPQVVGDVKNSTLVAFFVDRILKRQDIVLQKNAMRYLVDVEDVVRIVDIVVSSVNKNMIIDLIPKNPVNVIKIVDKVGHILNLEPKILLVDYGESYKASSAFLDKILPPSDIIFNELYWKLVLEKYVPLIAKNILLNT
jgi:nucleoside-diphosphate-sugar epimerase